MGRRNTLLNVSAHDYFSTTPFGVYCHLCEEPLSSNTRSLARHLKDKHSCFSTFDLKNFVRKSILRQNVLFQNGLILNYICYQTWGSVCRTCGAAYLSADSLRSHCYRHEPCSIDACSRTKVYVTRCGRVIGDERWHVSDVVLESTGLYRGFFIDYGYVIYFDATFMYQLHVPYIGVTHISFTLFALLFVTGI
jgi:hypothetical protein